MPLSPQEQNRMIKMTGTLLSIQVGKIQRLLMPQNKFSDGQPAFWKSAIFKSPVQGPVKVMTQNLENDEAAEPKYHGGPDNVALAYDSAHYDYWRKELNLPDLPHGAFGENFSVTGFSDDTVCIGDIWKIGTVQDNGGTTMQVTQARQPCFKLARRLERPDIVKRVRQNSWGGWYLRVLKEGYVEKGMEIELLERPHPDWTVAAAVQTMYHRHHAPARAEQLANLPELSTRWKKELLED